MRKLFFFSFMWTLTCGLVFGATYYSLRQGANDPQLQMVRDMRNSLNNGALAESFQQNVNPVDIKNSLSPFYMIFSEDHTVLASSGRLNNETLQVPSGVLEYVVNSAPSMVGGAEYRVTLEPQKGVRLAAVFKVAPLNTPGAQHHIVMAARNLIEVDSRIQYIQWVCAGVWLAGLLAIAGYSALSQRPEKRTA